MPFDQILEAVREGRVQAGLIIHEGQLTYATEGLHKVVDSASGGPTGRAACRCRSAATSSAATSGRS